MHFWLLSSYHLHQFQPAHHQGQWVYLLRCFKSNWWGCQICNGFGEGPLKLPIQQIVFSNPQYESTWRIDVKLGITELTGCSSTGWHPQSQPMKIPMDVISAWKLPSFTNCLLWSPRKLLLKCLRETETHNDTKLEHFVPHQWSAPSADAVMASR